MAKVSESGEPNLQVFQALDKSFKFQQSQAKKYADERKAASDKFNRQIYAFYRYLFAQLKGIGSKQIAVLIAMRSDLELTGDLAEIGEHMRNQWLRMEEHFDTLIVQLEQEKPAIERTLEAKREA